ncbi:transcription repressor OFP12-like [Oryza brachyantha]|uniref:transcription repressor OFP12-like n=1 Tax=Oryza brachyantha TaxID=4533 RepID=UPI001ADCBC7A|nr:transcription repressor OFP12-like [Oryza brachyantha]
MPRNAAMAGCFPAAGRRRALTLPAASTGVGAYEEGSTSAASTSVGTGSPPSSSSASTSSPAFLDDLDPPLYLDDGEAEADAGGLSTAIASRRLFFESPGRSNSIVDSAEHPVVVPRGNGGASSSSSGRPAAGRQAGAAAAAKGAHVRVCGDEPARPVPVSTAAPREEFLKSMVEMVDAMGLDAARRGGDRARLHELLLSYIALNDRDALPDILGAFTDLLFALNATGPAAPATDTIVPEAGGAKEREA